MKKISVVVLTILVIFCCASVGWHDIEDSKPPGWEPTVTPTKIYPPGYEPTPIMPTPTAQPLYPSGYEPTVMPTLIYPPGYIPTPVVPTPTEVPLKPPGWEPTPISTQSPSPFLEPQLKYMRY